MTDDPRSQAAVDEAYELWLACERKARALMGAESWVAVERLTDGMYPAAVQLYLAKLKSDKDGE